MPQSKLIEYAYPTSDIAKKAGYYNTGCWFIALYPEIYSTMGGITVPLSHSNNHALVTRMADSLPQPYNIMQE